MSESVARCPKCKTATLDPILGVCLTCGELPGGLPDTEDIEWADSDTEKVE